MPRILRNYLISFAIIGVILFLVNFLDDYLKERHQESLGQKTQENAPISEMIEPPQ